MDQLSEAVGQVVKGAEDQAQGVDKASTASEEV